MSFLSFDAYNIVSSLIVSLVIQAVFFAIAAIFVTDKVTDLSYSLSFVSIALLLLFLERAYAPLQLLAAAVVVVWGARLGGYLFVRIHKMKRDRRFDGIRENPMRFLRFWILQAVVVWLVMLPQTVLLSTPNPPAPGAVSWMGVLLCAVGLVLESVADAQKYRFKTSQGGASGWISSGVWKYSRHPNYFGEMLVWWGLFLTALPVFAGALWLTAVGPVSITLILLFVTGIPPLERKYEEAFGDDPRYQEYKRNTRLLIPLPRSR